MSFSTSTLKGQARNALLGNYPMAAAAVVLSGLVSYLIMTASAFAKPRNTGSHYADLICVLCSIIALFLSLILSTGSNYFYLNIARGKAFKVTDIFYAFTHHPDKVIVISVLLFLINFACMIPVTVIFALCSTAFSFTFSTAFHYNTLLPSILLLLVFIASMILIIRINLRYGMVYLLYTDAPEKSSLELLRESRQLMKGNCGRYFWLMLTFIGFGILCILSLGIGCLWILPYIGVTNSFFYLQLVPNEAPESETMN